MNGNSSVTPTRTKKLLSKIRAALSVRENHLDNLARAARRRSLYFHASERGVARERRSTAQA